MKPILLLYKKSIYKHFFLTPKKRPELAKVNSDIIKRFERTHTCHYQTLAEIEKILKTRKIEYRKEARGKKINYNHYDVIITVGGDGTFLEAARHVKKQVLLGVNSDPIWSVGRFCPATFQTFPAVLEQILRNRFKTISLNRLRVQTENSSEKINILNDLLVAHQNPAAMSRYYLTINRRTEEHRNSGVWISTAAGSTGAMHSAGGEILPPTSTKWQYKTRELYYGCGTTHRLTGGILSPQSIIKMTSLMKEGAIFADGSHIKIPFLFDQKISISKSPEPLRAIIP